MLLFYHGYDPKYELALKPYIPKHLHHLPDTVHTIDKRWIVECSACLLFCLVDKCECSINLIISSFSSDGYLIYDLQSVVPPKGFVSPIFVDVFLSKRRFRACHAITSFKSWASLQRFLTSPMLVSLAVSPANLSYLLPKIPRKNIISVR